MKNKLNFLLNYLRSNRGIGHTNSEINGVKNIENSLLIVTDVRQAKIFGLPENKVISINELDKLEGCRVPIVLDHYALAILVEEYKNEEIDKTNK